MPITPDRKNLYPPPKEWRAIRERILARAGEKCEVCGVRNGALGWRHRDGRWQESEGCCDDAGPGFRPVKIVLTIHHRDGDPTNNADENLQALCQLHHNRADGPMRARHAARTRIAKKNAPYGGGLFGEKAPAP